MMFFRVEINLYKVMLRKYSFPYSAELNFEVDLCKIRLRK